ncbi:MAG TPA: beta-L-arabinofuranosidase domain-containing protein [Trebonia sp.]|nr:beta-L-arabinofuranosidase domain-containing protein [Trebonia sp.]
MRENLFLVGRRVVLHTPDESSQNASARAEQAATVVAGRALATGGAAGLPGGPVRPTASAIAAQHPLAAPGARLTAGLLHDWQRRNVSASMPLALHQLEAAGNMDNLRLAISAGPRATTRARAMAAPAAAPLPVPEAEPIQSAVWPSSALGYHGPVFMDSDIYKTLEAIGWQLGSGPLPELRDFAAAATDLIERAQLPDGYLNSYVQASGEPRYSRLATSHEMYCAGHFIQAAIALHRGAGDPRALAIATRLADHLVSEFAGADKGLDGHPIIETALAELYRETGDAAYLDLARQFIDQRGYGLAGDSGMGRRYLQDHLPVRESGTEVGHVVRALYLEAGVTDVAVETGDEELLASSARRWSDMVAAKTYLTGGNGSRHDDEGFGDRFELPPDRAYNETCAAIASFHWSWRLLLATGEAKYADHMERILYNGFAGAIAATGMRFFYVNPLQRREDHFEKDDPGRRRVWFSCACCPPNLMRLLASVHHYLATAAGDTLFVQQYAGTRLSGAGLDIEVETAYPWSGLVAIRVLSAPEQARELALRIPPWSASTAVAVNGSPEEAVSASDGYLRLHRPWRAGDQVRLRLDLTPRWTYPDPRADAVRGCVAIERGPLVYCFEQADQAVRLDEFVVRAGRPLSEGAVTLQGVGPTIAVTAAGWHIEAAAGTAGPATAAVQARAAAGPPGPQLPAVAIPYFQWDNRGPGAMRVWIPALPS